MQSVTEVAERYGVSTQFMLRALAQLGFRADGGHTPLPSAVVVRFDAKFGEDIRRMRPAPTRLENTADRDDDFTPSAPPPLRIADSPPHLMRVAHAHHTSKRNMQTMERHKVLADNPGLDHALDPVGTREGDPWRGREAPGEYKFYENGGPHAACGARVTVLMGHEFVANDKPLRTGQCPTCSELVALGKGFRNPPGTRRPSLCESYLRIRIDGRVAVEQCQKRYMHDGQHRTHEGASWLEGFSDFEPSELDRKHAITRAP